MQKDSELLYREWNITFAEIPDETTLCVTIPNCPHRCKGCHSPYLQTNSGNPFKEIIDVIKDYKDTITCVCFMGGDANHADIAFWALYINGLFPNLKIAMYSGDDELDEELVGVLDYYKIGSWQEEKGPLNNPSTNQILYKKNENNELENITYKFWRKRK